MTEDRLHAAVAAAVLPSEEAFAELLRAWATENADGNVSTADLVALAERVSGQQVDDVFATWIDSTGKPAVP